MFASLNRPTIFYNLQKTLKENTMYIIDTYKNGEEFASRSAVGEGSARDIFSRAVKYASSKGVDRVVLTRHAFGSSVELENWTAQPSKNTKSRFHVKFARGDSWGDTRFEDKLAAIAYYEKAIRDPEMVNVVLQERVRDGYRTGPFGLRVPKFRTEILSKWKRQTMVEQIREGYGYKINGFNTAIDPNRSAKTAKWYKTESEALEAAHSMASRSSESLVIYKAVQVVDRHGIQHI